MGTNKMCVWWPGLPWIPWLSRVDRKGPHQHRSVISKSPEEPNVVGNSERRALGSAHARYGLG